MIAESSGSMMVLPVDIRSNSASDSDVFGARNDRRKEAARQEGRDRIGEQQASLRPEKSRFRIKEADAVESPSLYGLKNTDSGISVGSSIPARYSAPYVGRHDPGLFPRRWPK
jgi:hypothetical protein